MKIFALSSLVGSVLIHGWILLGHRNQLTSNSTDSHRDPIVNRLTMRLGLSTTVAWIVAFFLISPQVRPYLVDSVSLFSDSSLSILINLPWSWGSLPPEFFIFVIGDLVFLSGVVLRVWAIKTLGRLFTFEVGIRENHEVIRSGPYRYLRHPSYTGYLLMALAQGVIFQSLTISLFLFVTASVFLAYRISYEEKVLIKHFGSKYLDYQKESWRLIPGVY